MKSFRDFLPSSSRAAGQVRRMLPSPAALSASALSYVPPTKWIPRYTWGCLAADFLAGATVAMAAVPQAMAYASLANLPIECGIYTSFVGACLYWLLGTSKDMVIGATALGSLLMGEVVSHVQSETYYELYTNEEIAKTTSFLAGIVLLFMGLMRLGSFIDFLPDVVISAFASAAAVIIISTQLCSVLGVFDVDSTNRPYTVIFDTLTNLDLIEIDAVIGISCVVLLFIIQFVCSRLEVRRPRHKKIWLFLSSSRLAFVMVMFTFVSFLVNHNRNEYETVFFLTGAVPKGFHMTWIPRLDRELISLILPKLPAFLVMLVVNQTAIAKALGEMNEYQINSSQEILTLGFVNTLSPFIGGYAGTGSFGLSAILSKSGARTPLSGLVSGAGLVAVLYGLGPVFYLIPESALSGVLAHAVSNFITTPRQLHLFWRACPAELVMWTVSVAVSIVLPLEKTIFVAVGLSAWLAMARVGGKKGWFVDGFDSASEGGGGGH